jgi:hypothetical protein
MRNKEIDISSFLTLEEQTQLAQLEVTYSSARKDTASLSAAIAGFLVSLCLLHRIPIPGEYSNIGGYLAAIIRPLGATALGALCGLGTATLTDRIAGLRASHSPQSDPLNFG